MVNESSVTGNVEQESNLLHASALGGSAMLSIDGSSLGTVVDVVVDTRLGTVAYVVVASGGFMGVGETHYALPWSRISALAGGKHLCCRDGQLLARYQTV